MDVRLLGEVTFNEALTDVESLSDGGFLTIRDWSGLIPHTIEISSIGGKLSHAYYVAGLHRPWDDEARRRLPIMIQRLVRRGFGAERRTQQILQKSGVKGVLDEIGLVESNYGRRLYFQALVRFGNLDAATVVPVLHTLRDRINSDYERRVALEAVAGRVTLDGPSARAYVNVVESFKSDFERRQALSAILTAQPKVPGVADQALQATVGMRSDFERRQVFEAALGAGASLQGIEAVIPSLDSMRSSFEKRQVLERLIHSKTLSPEAQKAVLAAAATITSDFERRNVLTAFVDVYDVDQTTRDSYFGAVKGIRSDFERAEALLALVTTQAIDASVRAALVDATDVMRSSHEQNRVLAQVARMR
jgi:hypothetical protein